MRSLNHSQSEHTRYECRTDVPQRRVYVWTIDLWFIADPPERCSATSDIRLLEGPQFSGHGILVDVQVYDEPTWTTEPPVPLSAGGLDEAHHRLVTRVRRGDFDARIARTLARMRENYGPHDGPLD